MKDSQHPSDNEALERGPVGLLVSSLVLYNKISKIRRFYIRISKKGRFENFVFN